MITITSPEENQCFRFIRFSLVNYINLMTFDFYGRKVLDADGRLILNYSGPWDEKTGIFAPLFRQHYQLQGESLRNVVCPSKAG